MPLFFTLQMNYSLTFTEYEQSQQHFRCYQNIYFFSSTTFPIFTTDYHITENETGKNSMQKILFQKPNHIQKTIPKINSFEFRGEFILSSNLSFLFYVYSYHSFNCTNYGLKLHQPFIDSTLMRDREGSSSSCCFYVVISLL